MRFGQRLIVLLLAVMLFAGCAPRSRLENHWFDPSTTRTYQDFRKVLVIAFVPDEAGRRRAEAALARALGGSNQVVAHTSPVSSRLGSDGELARNRLLEAGFDGALVFRLLAREAEQRWVPGGVALGPFVGPRDARNPWGLNGFGPVWGESWAFWTDPGQIRIDQRYYYETDLYDLESDRIVWSGLTSTLNPSDFTRKVDSIAAVVIGQMRKDGVFLEEVATAGSTP
jgi:hypothetical protein